MKAGDVYLSAIKDDNGAVNVGYLVLLRSGRATIIVIATMVIGSLAEMWLSTTHAFNVQPLGVAIAAVLAAYGALLGGVAAFLWGDSKNQPVAGTVEHKETITTTASAPVAAIPIQPGVEPLSPAIGPEDVGKNIAIVPARKPNAKQAKKKTARS